MPAERTAESTSQTRSVEVSASIGLDAFYQVHVQVYSHDVPKGCKPFPTVLEARDFSFARRREGYSTIMIATKDGKPVPLSTLPVEVRYGW